jgi:hypothetical protein
MSTEKIDIILTTDRTMMSNHHGKEFLGFMATGPAHRHAGGIMDVDSCAQDEDRRAWEAMAGTIRIEEARGIAPRQWIRRCR